MGGSRRNCNGKKFYPEGQPCIEIDKQRSRSLQVDWIKHPPCLDRILGPVQAPSESDAQRESYWRIHPCACGAFSSAVHILVCLTMPTQEWSLQYWSSPTVIQSLQSFVSQKYWASDGPRCCHLLTRPCSACREEVYEPMIWVPALLWGHITHYNLTASNRAWPHRTATNVSSLTQALDSLALDYCLFATKLLK